ncbi:MAG: hypothetical protein GY869_11285 [Planctomycetes bacterium]|nr:hypothetical protein [Planctomycetota bacterium]
MSQTKLLILVFTVSLVTISFTGNVTAQEGQLFKSDLFENMSFRHIGPGIYGGRIPDIEVNPDNPAEVYVAGSTGGIFKSVNQGITFEPIFDDVGTSISIGDMALAPSDPLILWVGTGEASSDQSAGSIGDGVYKSIDGGQTFEHMGLDLTRHISRIAIDPTNPNIVFVGACGSLWGANPQRGLYRTKNGGRTWQQVLYINDDTGIADVVIDPSNGEIVYASTYQRRRRAWAHVRKGPYSRLYRSVDGGDSWQKLTDGLPDGDIGRIALAIPSSNPKRVYASVEHSEGGMFRSENRGNTWEQVNEGYGASYWYGRIYVDPVNADKIWHMATSLSVSEDGGETFTANQTAPLIHVDHHCLWINPKNPDHMMMGNDGGFYITYESGKNWDFIDKLPFGQYYAISVDNRVPYWVYGGLQDNGVWGVASRTFLSDGILNEHVVTVCGGDGFYSAADPRDYNLVFGESQNGGLVLTNIKTGSRQNVKPRAPQGDTYRFNWNSPFFISTHDPDNFYFGGNKLFKTRDKGQNWETISDDMSKNENLDDVLIMDLKPARKPYASLSTIAESPLQQGLIYAGTDDGNVRVTKDDGKNWVDLTSKFPLPQDRFVTRVLPSHHDVATCYVSFTRYWEADDFTPYLFKTTDYGQSWTDVTGDMPEMACIKCVVEHPGNPDLLFAGIHNGLLLTIDGGNHWIRLAGANLPPVAIDDIKIAPGDNDLVLGTYGRGIIILDDIAFLEYLDNAVLNSAGYLFPPRDTYKFNRASRYMFSEAARYVAPNPDYGVLITYYLDSELSVDTPETPFKIEILNDQGNIIRELTNPPGQMGINRIVWDLRATPTSQQRGQRGGVRSRSGDVEPGRYTVKLAIGAMELSQSVIIKPDPRK